MQIRILKMPDVVAKTTISRSKIYELIAGGQFPKPINLGPRAVGFLESEVDGWIQQRADSPRTVGASVQTRSKTKLSAIAA